MNEDILYKLWLNILCGHTPSIINKIVKNIGSAEEIYNSDEKYKKATSALPLSLRLRARRSLDKARELYEYCEREGIRILTIDDEKYPDSLREVYAPPQILYVKGQDIDFNSLVCVSIVGSRHCSENGKKFIYNLSQDLAKAGVLIVSGMAMGADAAAHRGAIKAGNMTVAVLAGGVDRVYPKENTSLYKEIVSYGAILSERPPGSEGKGTYYRERNRIITGLSKGVVIAEGELKSGTKLTADWAINSNRDLYAVPGAPTEKGSELPNTLIKSSAKLITSAEDILEEYIAVYPKELKFGIDLIDEERSLRDKADKNIEYNRLDSLKKAEKPSFESFDENQRKVLEYLYDKGTEIHIDEISRDLGIDVTELSFIIIQLLMARVIKEHPGEYYSIA